CSCGRREVSSCGVTPRPWLPRTSHPTSAPLPCRRSAVGRRPATPRAGFVAPCQEHRMDRCWTLLGLLALTAGLVALTSTPQFAAPLREGPTPPPGPAPRLPAVAAPAYHLTLSLN